MKKLTYNQICNLIKSGRKDEIPSGYNLIWVTPEPQVLFDTEISGEDIAISNTNDFPKPSKAHITGEYEILMHDGLIVANMPIDFGNVYLKTNFVLSKNSFEYEQTNLIKHWMNDRFFFDGRTIKKSDYVFDVTLRFKQIKLNIFNAWPKELIDNKTDILYDWVELTEY